MPDSRRRLPLAIALSLVLAGAGGATAYWWPDRATEATASAPPPVATAELVRQDLTTTQTLPGTLGYGASRPVAGAGAGIVTWMPKPGRVVRRGGQVYRVDDRPVSLFYGSLPLFRPVRGRDLVGRDVRVVA